MPEPDSTAVRPFTGTHRRVVLVGCRNLRHQVESGRSFVLNVAQA
jgi:hypothetical protein